jgi:cytochrome P450
MLQLDAFSGLIDELDEELFHSAEARFLPSALVTDPYGPLGRLRDQLGPVVERSSARAAGLDVPNLWLLDEGRPIFLVLGFDAVREAFRRGNDFSSKGWDASLGALLGDIIGFKDDPDHARYRGLLSQAFRRSHTDRWTAELVEPITSFLVDRLAERGGGDLVRDLAVPLPFLVTSQIMGLSSDNLARFVRLTTDLLNIGTDPAGALRARDELGEYFAAEVECRRRQTGDDLVSLLVAAEVEGQRLGDVEIVDNLRWLLPAGIETTFRSMSNLWALLLSHREQFALLTEQPKLIPAAVEESLRLQGPFTSLPRLATRDLQLAGVAIPAGSGVYLFHGVANRDPARWERPDEFDVSRPALAHLTFASGPHTCLGMHLARLQMHTSVRVVTERLPGIHQAAGSETPATIGFALRAAPTCPVAF